MEIIETFGHYVENLTDKKPQSARRLLKTGWGAQNLKFRYMQDKRLMPADRHLANLMMDTMLWPLQKPEDSVIVSIFTPCEMMQEVGLHPYNVEGFSCYLSASKAERAFLQQAENQGIAETLCSYHKTFLGAAQKGLLPKPKCIVYTNLTCDANLLTFRTLADFYQVPVFAIDVPWNQTTENVQYVADQLKDLKIFLEKNTGKTISEDRLKERLACSKRTLENYKKYQQMRADRYVPSDLVTPLYAGMTNNILLGTAEEEKYTQMLLENIKKAPAAKGKHIYWMHSVIAAAVREQQKEQLYSLSRPFVSILSEELNTGPVFGKEYEKAYLIPFSWSVADIMENHWGEEEDTDFLSSLFHVCFACSNYSLCEKLIDTVIEIQKDTSKFSVSDLAYSYRNKADLLLQFDRAEEASAVLEAIEELFDENNSPQEDREILNSQYGILYQIRGDYKKSRGYFEKCIDAAEKSEGETRNKDISTACSNMARMLVDAGDFFEAYDYIKRAINAEDEDANDSDQIICYSTLAAICTELMNAGFGTTYVQEGYDAFMKVIKFRKEKLGNHHADTAVIYHDFAYFWYIAGDYDKALKYNEMARSIEEELFAEYSITRMRSLNTKALVVWEQGKHQDADDIFEYIITTSEQMSSDYLPDVADFLFNYARCLHDQDEDEKAKAQYLKCINIWSEMSEDGNRKLALAHQEIADIFFSENNAADALEHYVLAEKFNAEDFYVEVDVLDSVAACLLLLDKPEEGIQKFKELLEILVKYKANDTEAKFQLCNNLFCIIDAESEEEIELREMLMEQIKDEPATVEYVHNFLTNREEK